MQETSDSKLRPAGDTPAEREASTQLLQRAIAMKPTWDGERAERGRPLIVEFAGTPKSGKSTSIDIVHHFFRRHGFKVFAPTEGVSKRTPRRLKEEDLLFYNVWSACYALSHLLESTYHSESYDIVIMDRGIFDVCAWVDWLSEYDDPEGKVKKIDRRLAQDIQKFMSLEPWQQLVDLLVLFTADPTTSLNRENKDKIVEKTGLAMRPDSLASLNEAYSRVKANYGPLYRVRLNIDTSTNPDGNDRISARESASRVVDFMLTTMEFTSGIRSE